MKKLEDAAVRKAPVRAQARSVILCVEDDEASSFIVKKRLEGDYEMLIARNDRDACALFRQHHARIDCILMDIELQGSTLNGRELTRVFRGSSIERPLPPHAVGLPHTTAEIVFLTAFPTRSAEQLLLETGGDHVMSKPVSFVRLNILLSQIHLRRAAASFSKR